MADTSNSASAVNGFARLSPDDGNDDMYPLLDMVVDCLPAPDCDPDGPLAMQCVTIDHSSYVGRIGIGRVYSGTIHAGCGTASYTFIWAMGGENQAFDDMDVIPTTQLK